MIKPIMILLFYCYTSYSKEPTIKQVESLIYSIENLSLVYKLTLFSQAILETGYFKNIRYNNIFGIMKKDGSKKHYSSFSACINDRIKLVNKHRVIIHKNYAIDKQYLKKVHKIMKKNLLSTLHQQEALREYINRVCPDYLQYNEYKLSQSNINKEKFYEIMELLEYPYCILDDERIYVIDKG